MHHTWRLRSKIFKQTLPENCSKRTKTAITACKFSNFFYGGACPRTQLELFWYHNQLQICSAEKKLGYALEKMWRLLPPPFKISRYASARNFTPKRVTSGGVHLHGLALGWHNCEETSQRWPATGDTVSDCPAREWNPDHSSNSSILNYYGRL